MLAQSIGWGGCSQHGFVNSGSQMPPVGQFSHVVPSAWQCAVGQKAQCAACVVVVVLVVVVVVVGGAQTALPCFTHFFSFPAEQRAGVAWQRDSTASQSRPAQAGVTSARSSRPIVVMGRLPCVHTPPP